MNYTTIEFTISKSFICFLEYGYDDNITNKEKDQLLDFINEVKKYAPNGYEFTHFYYGNDFCDNFKLCEVCNLNSDCVDIQAVYFIKD